MNLESQQLSLKTIISYAFLKGATSVHLDIIPSSHLEIVPSPHLDRSYPHLT